MSARQIQQRIAQLLRQKLNSRNLVVKEEWDVAKNRTDNFDRQTIYSPKVDVAVGPFMINYATAPEQARMRQAYLFADNVISEIKEQGEAIFDFKFNENSRCLIAIEVEASGTRKHLIGDIANASILGKIGLVVPTDEKNYRAFKRIFEYLRFARRNSKLEGSIFRNVILIKSRDLIALLDDNH